MNSWKDEEVTLIQRGVRDGKTNKEIVSLLAQSGYQRTFQSVKNYRTRHPQSKENKVRVPKQEKPIGVKVYYENLEAFKKEFIGVAVFTDNHYPNHIDPAPALRFLKRELKPEIIILLGDNLGLGIISHWNKERFKNIGLYEMRKILHDQLDEFKEFLDEIAKLGAERIIYVTGNHEDWIERFETMNPSFESREGMTLAKLVEADKRGISVLPLGSCYRVGKLAFQHGHEYSTDNPPKKALSASNTATIVFGHWHTYKVWSAFNTIDDMDKRIAIQLPCYANIPEESSYSRGKVNDWQNGFGAFIIKTKTGNFTPYPILVSPKGHFISMSRREYV